MYSTQFIMIFYKQTLLSTNADVYIPAAANIHGADVSKFKRGNVEVELPCLVYSIMPAATPNADQSQRAAVINDVMNSNRWSVEGVINALTLIRVFLIPDAAMTGNAACPYAAPTSVRHTIDRIDSVTLKDAVYHVYLERLSSITLSLIHI